MIQNELTRGELLDPWGNLNEAGYAKTLIKTYERGAISARKSRIKEWDYYYIGNSQYGIAFTIADNSYMGLGSVSLLDFVNKKYITKSVMKWFTNGKLRLPESSKVGDVEFLSNKCKLTFRNDGKRRILTVHFTKFDGIKDFDSEVELFDEPSESMVIATPFEKKHYFYYNQKINCMRAKGEARVGGKIYSFYEDDSFAVLDWGRGVWTYSNTWYWSSLNSKVNGKKIGFNLGYGFGDTSKATENMLFYDGKAYKIEHVTFHIPQDEKGNDDYLKPWTFTSNDKSVDLKFVPILDRYDNTNALIIASRQHQVFGKFSGTLVINGQKIVIKDLVGFAEKVKNRWKEES